METLKVLILEDNEYDMELVKRSVVSFSNYHFQFTWVVSKNDFIKALTEIKFDIVLSDYNLPQFNGIDALKISKEINPNIPFIIVTGTLTEEAAADSIKAGAWDYVVKERLHRLPLAVESVLNLKMKG